MNRVDRTFTRCREESRPAIMPYLTAGDPPEPGLRRLLEALDSGGADIIEIGIPFSDPIADGPVIASAMHRALERGTTPEEVLGVVGEVREVVHAALVAMVSSSIVVHLGTNRFVEECAESGLDGLIVPDADIDDLDRLGDACRTHGLTLSPLVAPTTPIDRQKEIAALASGFIYLLARAGVTGERTEAPEISGRIEALRAVTDLPICVGFGISSAEHVREVGRHADGAIVGSALVRMLDQAHRRGEDASVVAEQFVRSLHGN